MKAKKRDSDYEFDIVCLPDNGTWVLHTNKKDRYYDSFEDAVKFMRWQAHKDGYEIIVYETNNSNT